MNKEKYEDLMLRFAKELHDVGVTEKLRCLVSDQYEAHPNVISAGSEEVVRKFIYRYDGYSIEANQTVKLVVKKSS